MKEINFETVKLVNSLCLFDGEPHFVVNQKAIESALGNQYQPYEKQEQAFASVYKSLVLNHGFMNGNKRTAVIVLYLFSLMCGNPLMINDKDLAKLTYKIAGENGGQTQVEEIAEEVFKDKFSQNLNELEDVKTVASQFIKEHQWLMKELGK